MACGCLGLLFLGSAVLARAVDDAELLVQQSVGQHVDKTSALRQDVYVTTANSVEDLMYWAVMHKTMKRFGPGHTHLLQIRKDSPLNKRAHAIRMAIGNHFWNARLDLFNPSNLNLDAVDVGSWRQLAPFQYSPEEFKRVVHLNSDMVMLRNIDDLTHRSDFFTLARNQGDCKNLTDALASSKPSTVVLSMVPDTDVMTWLTSASTRLSSEATMTAEASEAVPMGKLDQAGMVSLAFQKTHPELPQAHFAGNEVMAATCLMHHKDKALADKDALESLQVLHWGEEGKKLINEIIPVGETRLKKTVAGLEAAGRNTLAHALRAWFDAYTAEDVKAIVDAAKNGPLAEW